MYGTIDKSQKVGPRGAAYRATSPREGELTPCERPSPEEYPVLANCYRLRRKIEERFAVVFLADEQIKELRKWYEFKDEEVVKGFLRDNFFLVGLLSDASEKIREYFGPDNPIALKVVKEHDAKDGRRLFVLIATTLRPREAVARLDELDRDWWLDALPAAHGKLTIDIYYS